MQRLSSNEAFMQLAPFCAEGRESDADGARMSVSSSGGGIVADRTCADAVSFRFGSVTSSSMKVSNHSGTWELQPYK